MAMERIVALGAVLAMTGCSLYSDDDPPVDVDAGVSLDAPTVPGFSGTWSVGWTCNGTCPDAGYSGVSTVTILEQPGRVTIQWDASNTDTGQRGERDLCAAFPDSNWKSDFEFCLVETNPPNRADATITWAPGANRESTWHAAFTRM